MLTFATVFPLIENATSEEVERLMRRWLIGSQHSSFGSELEIAGLDEPQWSKNAGNENVTGLRVIDGEIDFRGLRHEKLESNGIRWTTEIVYEGGHGKSQVSVQVHCESDSTALSLPPARKPYIVKQFLADIGGGLDGSLKVSDDPIVLKNDQIDYASDIINSNCGNQLPIVYLSATSRGDASVSAKQLAHWLSGVAHVVVEPNREFSFRLMYEVNHQNAYGGAVGVYWPDRSRKELLLAKDYDFDAKALAAEISKLIRNRAIRLRTPRTLTWAYQKELLAKQQIEKLRKDGSKDLDEYIQSFDEEMGAKEEALEKAETEIHRLEAEVYSLRAQSKTVEGTPVLVRGNESDLYENEALEFIVEILDKALSESHEGSRRQHVLRSLRAANVSNGSREEIMSRVKALLSNYRKLEGSISHELEELGFDIASEGKHHKITFKGDSRYVISMAKTSSDHRAGKNLVSQIKAELF